MLSSPRSELAPDDYSHFAKRRTSWGKSHLDKRKQRETVAEELVKRYAVIFGELWHTGRMGRQHGGGVPQDPTISR